MIALVKTAAGGWSVQGRIPAGNFDEAAVTNSIGQMVAEVQTYVPGYRLKGAPVFDLVTTPAGPRRTITLLLEVTGAGGWRRRSSVCRSAILTERGSTRLSQEPCLGVWTKRKRFGRVAR